MKVYVFFQQVRSTSFLTISSFQNYISLTAYFLSISQSINKPSSKNRKDSFFSLKWIKVRSKFKGWYHRDFALFKFICFLDQEITDMPG